jgi:hypothetical protein
MGLLRGVWGKACAQLIWLCWLALPVCGQQDWKLKKEQDGILVYTATTPNSDFKSIKVECTIKARASQLVAFLMDVDRQRDWVYNNKNSQLIKKIASNEMIFYSEVSVPWPCTNRDYISHITVAQPNPALVTIDAHSEPDLLPVKDGKVRVKNSRAHWDVTRLSSELLKIVYTVQFDPSGSVPSWLTNMFVTKGPLETFQKLREGVSKPAFHDAHVDFIKEL